VGGIPLRVRFPRLFELPENNWASVEDMGRRGWEVRGDAWDWHRRLHAWEEESVTECSILMHDVVLQANVHDRWRWLIDPAHGYSVKGTYQFLRTMDNPLKGDWWMMCGISKFHLRCRCSLGDFFKTGYQRRTICYVDRCCIWIT